MDSTLKLYKPFDETLITQGFSENANALYASQGLIGHTSVDWGVPHGTPIPNCANGAYCYSVMNREHPDPMKYRAVFTLVAGDNGLSDLAEVSYGHFDEIYAEVGKTYRAGDILGTCGNTGPVFVGGREVTREEKEAGSKAGAHLHGPQVRPVKKVAKKDPRKQYLYDGNGLLKIDGMYLEVINYKNGTNGCINPMPFFSEKQPEAPLFPFTKDLYQGIDDPEVRALQKFLNSRGYRVSWVGAGSPGRETTFFGPATEAALKRFQKEQKISPAYGYFGPKTRDHIRSHAML